MTGKLGPLTLDRATLYCGDSREVLPLLEPEQFTACVCDPPYHLTQASRKGSPRNNDPKTPFGRTRLGSKGFMGKTWDGGDVAFRPEFWAEVLRVLKPGAMLLAFGGTRTFHRLTCAIEDAGFEIRDCLMWIYGSGFPKSLDISKALDKMAGAEREVVGRRSQPDIRGDSYQNRHRHGKIGNVEILDTVPATELARRWDGWGTSLKPAWEPILLAMKPLDGTFAQNARRHGVAGLNIDNSRIGVGRGGHRDGEKTATKRYADRGSTNFAPTPGPRGGDAKGRWPANLILDEEAGEILDKQSGERPGCRSRSSAKPRSKFRPGQGEYMPQGPIYPDTGGVSRFFKRCEPTEAESCESVSIAESVLSQPSQAAGFVQNLAAIAGNHADRQFGDSIRRFTNAMQAGSSGSDKNNTQTIRNTGKKCLQELRRTSTEMLNGNRVNVVETQRLTSITLITQNLLNTLGSVDRATSRSMCECLALGAKGCESPSSRFLYCAKASKRDRTCDGQVENNHPTVKPRSLMEYLCRLVTPPGGGLILDPFMGSGSTGIAALATGNRFVGIELEPESFKTAQRRIEIAAQTALQIISQAEKSHA